MKSSNTSRAKLNTLISGIAIAILCIVILFMSVDTFRFINEGTYSERRNFLDAQIKTIAEVSNGIFQKYSEIAEKSAAVLLGCPVEDREDVMSYLDGITKILYLDKGRLILVDDSCVWYGSGNETGRITSVDQYLDETDRSLVYITKPMSSDSDMIVFRVRLDNPVQMNYNGVPVSIRYSAIVYDMNQFLHELDMTFPFEGNRFIVDKNGFMLFAEFQLGVLVPGSNLFSKYGYFDFHYGQSSENLVADMKSGKETVAEFTLNDTNYFIATHPLDFNGWTISYLVKSDFLSSGSYISSIFKYVLGIATIFIILSIGTFILVRSLNDKQKTVEYQNELNEKLQQASRSKSEFLSNMSHDIRTPINGIVGMTLLAQKQDNPPKTSVCLKNIDQASQHLLSLINDILDMSAIESGKIELVCKPVSLHTLVSDCASIIEGQIQNRTLNFEKRFCEPFSWVYADSLKLRQILINILSNAVKYTLDGGTIVFGMDLDSETEDSCRVKFTVSDTGIGMKKEFIPKLFDAFTQEDGGARTRFIGTGLGMAITKNYVDMMGGTIEVESEINHGSTFTVVITFKKAESEHNEEIFSSGVSLDGLKVLLVEDNALNMTVASELLEDEGVSVTKATNGKEAVNIFTDSPSGTFDIIIMDVMMPVMNGLDATRFIRSSEKEDAKTIPIIAMTANAFESDIQATKDAGMNAHLIKPININEVLSTLNSFNKKGESRED